MDGRRECLISLIARYRALDSSTDESGKMQAKGQAPRLERIKSSENAYWWKSDR